MIRILSAKSCGGERFAVLVAGVVWLATGVAPIWAAPQLSVPVTRRELGTLMGGAIVDWLGWKRPGGAAA